MGRTCAQTAAAISSPNRLYTRAQGSMPCTMCLVAWHTAGILANGCLSPNKVYGICWCHFLAVLALILLDITVSEHYWILANHSKLLILLKITDITQCFAYYSILSNTTQYYWYYSILRGKMILEWSWGKSGHYSVSNITEYYKYYEYYIIFNVWRWLL